VTGSDSASPHATCDEPLVGREAELSRLDTLLEQAIEGSGCEVFITGDLGIGKTALVEGFFRRARRRHESLILVRGRCVEQYGAGEAYLPFLDAAGTLLVGRGREAAVTLFRTYAPTWCLQLPAVAALSEERAELQGQTIGATKERMLREMGDVFEAAAATSPVVGLVEDLQWADPSTLDLLRHLGNRIARQRILVLVTFRASGIEADSSPLRSYTRDLRVHKHCHEIALGPLSQDEVAAYLDGRFAPNRFPAGLGALVQRRTEGHPLFLTKLMELLVERGDVAEQAGHWTLSRPVSELDVEAPESVRGIIRRQLDALGEEDRSALTRASVIGRDFTSTTLASLLQADEVELEERLDRLARSHHLIEAVGEDEQADGSVAARYRFAHTQYQEVLYADLPSKRRVLLHRQVGEDLTTRHGAGAPRIAAQLALHFERGRDLAKAIKYLMQAADNAAGLYAYGEAREYLSHALELAEKLTPESRSQSALALYQKRGAASLALGRFDDAVDDYTRMLEQARLTGRAELECGALAGLCNALFFSRRMEEMAIRANEALRAAAKAGSESLRVEALASVALILIEDGGNLAEAKPLLDDIIARARRLGHSRALTAGLAYRGAVHYWQTEYERAEELLSEAAGLASEQRDGFIVLLCLGFLGLSRSQLGRMSEALSTLQEGTEMARRNGDRFWLPYLVSHLGSIHRELQDFGAAVLHDEEGLRTAREDEASAAETSVLINLALDKTQGGRGDQASEVLGAIRSLAEGSTWLGWWTGVRLKGALAEHRLGRGELAEAREAAEQFLDSAARHDAHTHAFGARRLLAEVELAQGEPGAAIAHLDEALEQLQDHPAPLITWRIYATLGRARSALGEVGAASEARREAAAIVRGVADNVHDEALRATFLSSAAVQDVLD